MSLNSDYFVNTTVQQRRAELVAEAESDRLARLVRSTRPSWLRRLRSALSPSTVPAAAPVPAPAAPPAADEPQRNEPTEAVLELVGAGRHHGA